MSNYLVHKACEAEKCKKPIAKVLTQPGYLEAHYRAFAKYDGCCVIVFVNEDGTVYYLSRTGEHVNMHHLDEDVWALFKDIVHLNDEGIVLFGEAWWPGADQFPEISGAFRRHAGDPNLRLVLNDAVLRSEYDQGVSSRPFHKRLSGLRAAFPHFNCPYENMVSLAREYGHDEYITAKDLAAALVYRGGYDGLILRDPDAGWVKGHDGNDGAIIKVKHRVTYDLLCTGLEEGKGAMAGMTGALVFKWNDTTTNAGTGLSKAHRVAFWNDPSLIVGKIVEIEGLGLTNGGVPREPSIKGIRHDKLQPDK